MKTVTINLYEFDECDSGLQKRVLENYRHINTVCNEWDNYTCDEFMDVCVPLGISITEGSITYTLSGSQGDHAGYEGTADVLDLMRAMGNGIFATWIKQNMPFETLPEDIGQPPTISAELRQKLADGEIEAHVSCRPHPVQSFLTTDFETTGDCDLELDDKLQLDDLERWGMSVFRVLQDWLFTQLQNGYVSETSDDAVAETLRANEYHFGPDGKIHS